MLIHTTICRHYNTRLKCCRLKCCSLEKQAARLSAGHRGVFAKGGSARFKGLGVNQCGGGVPPGRCASASSAQAGITENAAAAGQRQGNRTLLFQRGGAPERATCEPQDADRACLAVASARRRVARAVAWGERTHNERRYATLPGGGPDVVRPDIQARPRAAWCCLAAAVTSPTTFDEPITATVGRSFAAATAKPAVRGGRPSSVASTRGARRRTQRT